MVKHEIKVEFNNSNMLLDIIKKSYLDKEPYGKISGSNNFITITENDDPSYNIFKGLNGITTKLTNEEVINGTMRFMVDERNGDLRLYPVSIYCIEEDNRYIFY